jgi:membrane protein
LLGGDYYFRNLNATIASVVLSICRGDLNGTLLDYREGGALNWPEHRDARQGAALAYYSVFSIGPVVVIAAAIAGLAFGREAVNGEVASSIKGMMGDTGAKAVQAMLADASRPRQGIVATLLGIGALVFAAIGVVVQLKDALNVVWEVKETQSAGVWPFLRSYVISLAAVPALGFLLTSMLVTALLAAVASHAAAYVQEWVLHLLSSLVSFAAVSVLFAMMFKWLPDISVDWYDVWLRAIVTGLLFEFGKSAIGFYIGKQGLESTYGAAASIVVVLIWVYYSAQIVLMGAEVTHAFALHQGSLRDRKIEDAGELVTLLPALRGSSAYPGQLIAVDRTAPACRHGGVRHQHAADGRAVAAAEIAGDGGQEIDHHCLGLWRYEQSYRDESRGFRFPHQTD